jgi:hypothetical protein
MRSCTDYQRLFAEYQSALVDWSASNKNSSGNSLPGDSTVLEQIYQRLTDHQQQCPICSTELGLEPLLIA